MRYRVIIPEHLFSQPDPSTAIAGVRAELDDPVDEVPLPIPLADWVKIKLVDDSEGFFPRKFLAVLAPDTSLMPDTDVEKNFFLQLRVAALDPGTRTDHHYLYAAALADSGVQNIASTIAGSDAFGPFQYTAVRWTELIAAPGAPVGLTAGDRQDWGAQIGVAAFEASKQAAAVVPLLPNRSAVQYNELFVMHELGDTAGTAIVKVAAADPNQVLQQVAGLSAALTQAHPKLFTTASNGAAQTVGDVLDAATRLLQPGFEKAADLAAQLDPPELNPTVAPVGAPAPNSANFTAPPGVSTAIAKHKADAQRVIDALAGTAWTRPQMMGIIANIYSESGFNPAIPGDGGSAYGLCQWHRDRQKKFRLDFGKAIQSATFEDQVKFIDDELRTSEKAAGDLLKRQTTAGASGFVVSLHYERPLNGTSEANNRAGIAEAFATLMGP